MSMTNPAESGAGGRRRGPAMAGRKGIAASVVAARDGDQAAWDHLVDRFAPAVWDAARKCGLSTTDAARVSQATWLRLLEHLPWIERPESIGAWLVTAARRESVRLLRLAGQPAPDADGLYDPA
jgi:DNA-directed RNA polymerase specialized sigma24 family protein